MMRIWKRALAIVLTLALAVPNPVFAGDFIEEEAFPEALTPELQDDFSGEDSYVEDPYAEGDDWLVEPDSQDYGAGEWDMSSDGDAAGGSLEAGGLIEDLDGDADTGDNLPQDAMMPAQDAMMPEVEIDLTEETEAETEPSVVTYRIVTDDMIEGAEADCPEQAAAGETVPVLVRPDSDHSIRNVVAHYYDASLEGHQIEMEPLVEDENGIHYEFIMPDADVAIYVMTEALHDVTVLQSEGGTVTASLDRAGFSDTVALTAEPDEGYSFVDWEIYEESGSQIGVRSDNTFLMGFEAVTVRAIFERLQVDHAITLTQSGEGTVVSSAEQAEAGEIVTITASPQSGYRMDRITVTADTSGEGVILDETEEMEFYSFVMPDGDVTVHVQFEQIPDHVVRVVWNEDVTDRPQRVIVELQKKNGNSWVYGGTSVRLSDENGWTSRISLEQQSRLEGEWRFRLVNDQMKGTVHAAYDEDADGTPAIYSVTRESSINLYATYQYVEYTISETGTEIRLGDPSIEMTFPVQVVWGEGENPRPEQITAALQKQSAGDSSWTTVETLELSAENNWKSEFYRIIEERGSSYRVRELTPSGEVVEDGSTVIYNLDEDGETVPYTWQNSHTLDYTYNDAGMTVLTKTPLDVPVSKNFSVEIAWDAKEERYPASVYAALQRRKEGEEDWETVERVSVKAENDWKAEFAPVSATRKDSFRILEVSSDDSLVQDGERAVFMDRAGQREREFQVSYTESSGVLWGSCVISNTYILTETDVRVNLVWEDANNDDGLRPKEVKVDLLADGADTGTDLVLSPANLWSDSFMDLPLHNPDTEELITYTVSVPDTEVITGEDGTTTYLAEVARSEEDEDAWTITLRHTPRMKQMACQVVYDDQNNQDGKRPDTARVVLTSSAWDYGYTDVGSEYTREFMFESRSAVRNGKEVQFQISAAEIPGYECIVSESESEYIEEEFTTIEHYIITFRREPEKTSLSGRIVWKDDAEEAGETGEPGGSEETEAETENVSVAGKSGEAGKSGDRPETVTVRLLADGEEVRQIEVSKPWTFAFDDLDCYRDGTLIQYDVSQDPVENYTLQKEYDDEEGTYTFLNTKVRREEKEPATIDVSVQVEYDDADNQDGIRPDSVVVQLSGSAEEEQTTDEDGGWGAEFHDLPEDGVYHVKVSSDSVITGTDGPGTYRYEITGSQAEGFTVKLTHTPETITLSGLINWEDDDNREEKRPEEVTVRLQKEGEELDFSEEEIDFPEVETEAPEDSQPDGGYPDGGYVVIARSSEGWNWSFEDVPKYEDGQEILYTVSQDAIDNYVSTVDGYEITNTYDAPAFTTHSLLLSGEIGINFFMDLPEADGVSYEDSYMEFRINGRNARTMEEEFDPAFRDINDRGYYGFTVYVNSNEMAEPVTAVFHYGDGQTMENTYSVRDYIIAYDEVQDQFDAQTTALVHAVADYGHYVQPVLAQSNSWTIGVDYKEMDKYYTSSYDYSAVEAAVAGYEIIRDTGDSDIKSITFALNLLTRTQIYLYFVFTDGYRGGFGATVDGSPVVMVKQNTRSYVQTPDISAHQLSDRHDVIVRSNSGTASVSVSPLDYVHAAIGAGCDSNTRNAAAAIYYYYQAAQAYQATH